MLTTEQRQALKTKGVVTQGQVVFRQFDSARGHWTGVPYHYLVHYFDADGEEVATLLDLPCGGLMWHDPPRRWGPDFRGAVRTEPFQLCADFATSIEHAEGIARMPQVAEAGLRPARPASSIPYTTGEATGMVRMFCSTACRSQWPCVGEHQMRCDWSADQVCAMCGALLGDADGD